MAEEVGISEHLLVFDLEATCDDRAGMPKHEMESIEIGAVILRSDTLSAVSEFRAFVRPLRHARLTEFCKTLTSIRQEDVDAAPSFPEVIVDLRRWLYAFSSIVPASWGDSDRRQLEQDCRFHAI